MVLLHTAKKTTILLLTHNEIEIYNKKDLKLFGTEVSRKAVKKSLDYRDFI